MEILVREESVKQGLRRLLMQNQRQKRCINSGQPTEKQVEWQKSLRNEAVKEESRMEARGRKRRKQKRDSRILIQPIS